MFKACDFVLVGGEKK